MFFQLMVAVPLARSFMTCEEVDLDGPDVSPHQLLLMNIEERGLAVAAQFAEAKRPGAYGKVKPRDGFSWPWRTKKLRLWRLLLVHPLWLGADGVIYRGYGPAADFYDRPDYWMRAEIERRGIDGLERVWEALADPDGQSNASI